MRIGKLGFLILSLVGCCLTPAANAQDEEEVFVRAGAAEAAVRSFVDAVTEEAGSRDQLAVWGGRLCIGVMGLRETQSQAVIDQIAAHAENLGVDLGRSGCAPNLLIVFTTDSDRVARVLVDEYRRAFAYHATDGVTRGRTALEEFAATPRAVRWWHVSAAGDDTGGVVMDRGMPNGPAGSLEGVASIGAPAFRTTAVNSRIGVPTQQNFTRAVIVVDTARAAGMRLDSLANYLSMAALAQLDPTADTSAFPTILNAFSSGSPGNVQLSLTEWDQAYLDGLYNSPANRRASAQRRAIQRSVIEAGEQAD